MHRKEIAKYYDDTESRSIRDDLIFAASVSVEPKIAIDCGCGAGADINYLLTSGFTVHGFDVDEEAISRCRARFKGNDKVSLARASFDEYDYPKASLVVADASLFFCPRADFKTVWSKIYNCLVPNGIFCGSFLGTQDTMAAPGDNPSVFWPATTAFEEADVRALMKNYEVLRFNTIKSAGKTSQGRAHHWHIYQVVARKPNRAENAAP
ncbi:MAG: class I SAM-dependent methyltransferase [Pseudohongiellaceae bacterium]|nr:class I SAM-dependent methyltransferase [Pseudohongiellaceae bacterium]